MIELNGEELNDRHQEFLREVRRALGVGFVREQRLAECRAQIKSAQESYSNWFAARGIRLIFTEEP